MDAARFFELALPRRIQEHPVLFDSVAATVSISVHGVGAWTVRFGDHTAPSALEAKLDLDADLVLSLTEAQFAGLFDAEQPRASAPAFVGNTKLLGILGRLVQPPAKGGLGARLARF